MPASGNKIDPLTSKERCLHYIGWHANAYGAPADAESIRAVVGSKHDLTDEECNKLLESLHSSNEIEYWAGEYTEGFIIPEPKS